MQDIFFVHHMFDLPSFWPSASRITDRLHWHLNTLLRKDKKALWEALFAKRVVSWSTTMAMYKRKRLVEVRTVVTRPTQLDIHTLSIQVNSQCLQRWTFLLIGVLVRRTGGVSSCEESCGVIMLFASSPMLKVNQNNEEYCIYTQAAGMPKLWSEHWTIILGPVCLFYVTFKNHKYKQIYEKQL